MLFRSWRAVRTLVPIVAITILMYVTVTVVGGVMSGCSVIARLAVEIVTGVVVYTVLSLVFRLEAVGEIRGLIRKMISK